jgi:hypothetical protein
MEGCQCSFQSERAFRHYFSQINSAYTHEGWEASMRHLIQEWSLIDEGESEVNDSSNLSLPVQPEVPEVSNEQHLGQNDQGEPVGEVRQPRGNERRQAQEAEIERERMT